MPGIMDIDPRRQGLLAAAFQGLQASGPKFGPPASLGQIIGQAGQAGMQQMNRSSIAQQEMQIRQQQFEQQQILREQQAARMEADLQEKERKQAIIGRIKEKIKPGMTANEMTRAIAPDLIELDPVAVTNQLSNLERQAANDKEKVRQWEEANSFREWSKEAQLKNDQIGLEIKASAQKSADSFNSLKIEIEKAKLEAAQRKGSEGKPVPTPVQSKLSEQAQISDTSERLLNNFKDEYGGYGSDAAAYIALQYKKRFGNGDEAANYWQDYKMYENEVRHKLFGGALTATEVGQWQAATVTPGMDPKLIRKNLERRSMIERRGLERLMNSSATVYNRDQIEQLTGRSLGGGGPPDKPKAKEFTLDDGRKIVGELGPDGKYYVNQNGQKFMVQE